MDIREPWSWQRARALLPPDLEGLARETGFVRRLRGTDSAEGLLRLLLLCAVPKASLRQVASWGCESGLCRMNSRALFFRLRDSGPFLERVLEALLARGAPPSAPGRRGRRLLAADGTSLCGPGARGTDLRVHALYDLSSGTARRLEATPASEGEGLARHAAAMGPGDLVLADRGYGRARGLLAALGTGAGLLVRFEFSHLRLLGPDGRPVSAAAARAAIAGRAALEIPVRLEGGAAPLRALGHRAPDGGARWLLTNLDERELPLAEAPTLYAQRWQVELFFKRMKSLLDLDELPSPRNGPTARPWALAKLILATLAALLAHERFSPWGQGAPGGLALEALPQRPVAPPARPARLRPRAPRAPREGAQAGPAQAPGPGAARLLGP